MLPGICSYALLGRKICDYTIQNANGSVAAFNKLCPKKLKLVPRLFVFHMGWPRCCDSSLIVTDAVAQLLDFQQDFLFAGGTSFRMTHSVPAVPLVFHKTHNGYYIFISHLILSILTLSTSFRVIIAVLQYRCLI